MMKYEIMDVKPFNDVYYIDCLHISLFTALKHFNGSAFSYIVNDNFIYKLCETEKGLTLRIEKLGVEAFDKITAFNGISINYGYECGNEIIDSIISALINGCITIIPIDAYFYNHPYHKLFYLKEHHYQTILVYGYDYEKKVFKTIDVNGFKWNKKDFCYKYEISFQDLIKCHEARFQSGFEDGTIIKVSKTTSSDIVTDNPHSYKDTLINNMLFHKTEILKGLQDIFILYDYIDQFDMDEPTAFNNLVASVSNLYKIKNILGNEYINSSLTDDILNVWIVIRNMFIKSNFNIVIKKEEFGCKLKQLFELETMFYKNLFCFFDNYEL